MGGGASCPHPSSGSTPPSFLGLYTSEISLSAILKDGDAVRSPVESLASSYSLMSLASKD